MRYVEIAGHFWVIDKKESHSFSALVLWCSVFYPSRFLGSFFSVDDDEVFFVAAHLRKHPGEFRQGVVSRQMTSNQGSDLGTWPMCGWAAPL